MSTIPAGLRADKMRKLIEDKATIKHVGGLYMGKFMDFQKEYTQELPPGDQYTVLNSIKGLAVQQISYQKLLTESFAGEITSEKLATGVIQDDLQADKKYIDFLPNSQKHNLGILFDPLWSQPSAGDVEHQLYVSASSGVHIKRLWKKLPVKFDDGTGEPKKYYVLQYYGNGESPVSTVCAYANLGILPGSAALGTQFVVARTNSPYADAPASFYRINNGNAIYFKDRISITDNPIPPSQHVDYPRRVGYGDPDNLTWELCESAVGFTVVTTLEKEPIDNGRRFMVGVYERYPITWSYTYGEYAQPGDGTLSVERTASFTQARIGSLALHEDIFYGDQIKAAVTMKPYALGTLSLNNSTVGVIEYGNTDTFSFTEETGNKFYVLNIDSARPAASSSLTDDVSVSVIIQKSNGRYTELVRVTAGYYSIDVININGSGFNDFYDTKGKEVWPQKTKVFSKSSDVPPVIRPDRLVTVIFKDTGRAYYVQATYPEIPE